MQVMSDSMLKSQNNFIKEKEVTKVTKNITQFKEGKNVYCQNTTNHSIFYVVCICVLC